MKVLASASGSGEIKNQNFARVRTLDVHGGLIRDGGAVARADGGQEQIDWSSEVTKAANLAIANAASSSGDLTVDLVKPFKNGGDEDPTPLLADDGDHPNAAGVKAIVAANMAATRA